MTDLMFLEALNLVKVLISPSTLDFSGKHLGEKAIFSVEFCNDVILFFF